MTEKFIESIENSVKQHFKLKKICACSKPWMNDHVKKAIKSSGKWDNPTTKDDLDQARLNLEKIIQDEMHKHWKHFQNETAELPQNKF